MPEVGGGKRPPVLGATAPAGVRWGDVLSGAIRGLVDLLAPRRCPGCDLELAPDEPALCGACGPLLEPLPPSARAAYALGGPLADGIRRLKYAGRSDHAEPLGAIFAGACADLVGTIDLVVPIPLHPRRLAERGYNQSALLAVAVARALGAPLAIGALRRIRDTPAQAGLDAGARSRSIRGCFSASLRRPARVLLVDDVRTTGATFAEASLALRAGGALAVQARALAGADET